MKQFIVSFEKKTLQKQRETDWFVIVVVILESISAFGLVGFACEMGQESADRFDEVNDEVDKLNWYKFPMELQRLLPMIIHIAQQEVPTKCFGSAHCSRESFKSVRIDEQTYISTSSNITYLNSFTD